ncbi:MAG: hypothetical protein QM638_08080 [Nocardioides sp.]|uniref:hypothetical protein n=1 Tax=Nocardioides sp. TaxID=35761 RepID=UPI0039E43F73
MAGVRPATTEALRAFEQALVPPRAGSNVGNWRWSMRQRLARLREALMIEDAGTTDAWLTPRTGSALRERGALLSRLSCLGDDVLDRSDLSELHRELQRLAVDLHHHLQRISDLAYDEVELELGGSD